MKTMTKTWELLLKEPVSYISRALTAAEQRYAKEALAVTWACERFWDHLVGLHFHIETDHKTLVHPPFWPPRTSTSCPSGPSVSSLLMGFSFSMSHVPGKELVLADSLSRAPVSNASMDDEQFQQEVEAFVNSIIHQLPTSEQWLHNTMEQQHTDEACQQLAEFCHKGSPSRSCLRGAIKFYLPVANEQSIHNRYLLRENRLVIPTALCQKILQKNSLWTPGYHKMQRKGSTVSMVASNRKELENLIHKCPVCCK